MSALKYLVTYHNLGKFINMVIIACNLIILAFYYYRWDSTFLGTGSLILDTPKFFVDGIDKDSNSASNELANGNTFSLCRFMPD